MGMESSSITNVSSPLPHPSAGVPLRVTQSMRGGSLCEIIDLGPLVHKYYKGDIARGHEKILKEYWWYMLVPVSIRQEYPFLLPSPLLGSPDREYAHPESFTEQTSLYLPKFPRRALSKLIMGQALRPTEAASWFEISLACLLEIIYPIRTCFGQRDLFSIFHAPRLQLAVETLRQEPQLKHLFEPAPIIINGTRTPSLYTFLTWLEGAKIQKLLDTTLLISVHGNLHPDNILVDDRESPSRGGVTFIDPRGDLLGPLYYDVGKLMTSLHSRYDEIHYGNVRNTRLGHREYEIIFPYLDVDETYVRLLRTVTRLFDELARFTYEEPEKLVLQTIVCEAIHTLSFSFYHLKRTNHDILRVETFLVTACYLGALAMRATDSSSFASNIYSTRLNFESPV